MPQLPLYAVNPLKVIQSSENLLIVYTGSHSFWNLKIRMVKYR